MDQGPGITSSRWGRVFKILIGVALLVCAAGTTGLVSLLSVMAAVVPFGAALANVSLLPGMRDTLHDWHYRFEDGVQPYKSRE